MADRNPKSDGMSWLNPMIIVKDVKKSLDFYEKAFGFQTKMSIPDKDGNVMHAEMNYKDNVFMLGPASRKFKTKTPKTFKGTPVSFYLYVENVEKAFEQAKKAGAKVVTKPVTQFWGDRIATVNCGDGHKWTLAQNVADFDPANVPG